MRTFNPPVHRLTAQVFVGVADVVTGSASATTSQVGQSVTFTGTVAPDKTGHVIYLEQRGSDGHFHIVKTGSVFSGSTYQFHWTFGTPGTKVFEVLVTGGPDNVAGVSPAATVTVSLPAISSLPPAS